MNQQTQHTYNVIRERLAAVRRRQITARIANGLLTSLLVFAALSFCAVLVEQSFSPGTTVRTVLFWLTAGLSSGCLLVLAGHPLLMALGILHGQTEKEIARSVGRAIPAIRDRLVNVLELYDDAGRTQLYFSTELIDAAFDDVRVVIEPLNFLSVVDYGRSRSLVRLVAGVIVAGAVGTILFPSAIVGSATRLLQYSHVFAAPAPFRFVVEPGNRDVLKGERVQVVVRVEGAQQRAITFASRPVGQVDYDELQLVADAGGAFVHEFTSLKSSTVYLVHSGPVTSETFLLRVLDRPSVKLLRLQRTPPSYTRLPPRFLDDNIGDVIGLPGTRIHVSVEASKDLAAAEIAFSDSSRIRLQATGNKAAGSMSLLRDRTYRLRLQDQAGAENADPIEYSMRIVPDAYPAVSVLLPGKNVDVTDTETLPLLIRIRDDYGFSALRLAYKLAQSRYEKPSENVTFVDIPLPESIGTERLVPYLWALAALHLVPEDVVTYYLEVFDNDDVSGPKSAVSELFSMRLPSLEEVLSDVEKGHEASLETLREALRESQEAKSELEELQRDMKTDQEKMDWNRQQKTEELLRRYEDIRKKLDDVNRTVDKMVGDMEKNRLLSQETLEKYQELQQLMEQVSTPELLESMKRLQDAMHQMNPDAMRQALQQFSFSEENFRKSIERTLNLLKRIQIEQRVDEVIRRTQEMIERQEEANRSTQESSPQNAERLQQLAQQQRDLAKDERRLEQELADLQRAMNEFPREMPLEEIDSAAAGLAQNRLGERLDNVAQNLERRERDQALEGQQQALQHMAQLRTQLDHMRQAMREGQQQHITNEMRRSVQDLLELSQRQEQLKNDAAGLEQNSQRFRENAQEQMELLRDLGNVVERMSGLSQKTFSITPDMGRSVGEALKNMNDAVQSLDQRNGSAAMQQQTNAMASLNETAQQMQSAMNAMMQGKGQGMGMAGFLQRLQQLAGMQQGINQGTQNLGGLSPQQAAEMARLAGEQGMVRKSLEQLAREASQTGQLSKMLGDLKSIAEEMREVQTDLVQGDVSPATVQKQDRILSRLLDAQRSTRERDYEKRRRAESGQDVPGGRPGPIDVTTQEGKNLLHKDLLKALEEGYAKDYEEIIKRYFEALHQLSTPNQ